MSSSNALALPCLLRTVVVVSRILGIDGLESVPNCSARERMTAFLMYSCISADDQYTWAEEDDYSDMKYECRCGEMAPGGCLPLMVLLPCLLAVALLVILS